MTWLRLIVRAVLGRTEHHQIANETNNRRLRAELLAKQLEVVRRGK